MTINTPSLIAVISEKFPGVVCNCYGDPYTYANLEAVSGNLPSEQQLLEQQLNMVKERKIEQLSDICRLNIVSGFTSSVLGEQFVYDTSPEDQINLLGSVAATQPDKSQYYSCRDPKTLVKTYRLHTHAQLRQLLDEGANWKLALLQQFHVKRAMVENCSTIQDVLNIN